jgi:hypothetical protein
MKVVKHAVCLFGCAAVVYGVWLVYHPAGWIIGGAMAFYISLMIDKSSG